MKQKKINLTVLLLLVLGITALQAQQNANASGGDAAGAGGTASYSIGQIAYTYNSGSSNQGVQQPYEFFVTGIDEYKNISLSINVFPNPVQSILKLKIENLSLENLSYQIYDVSGKLLIRQNIANSLTDVTLQSLASGTYFLKVSDQQKELKTFTIIKKN
jgi:opacity protein-like surface antigen